MTGDRQVERACWCGATAARQIIPFIAANSSPLVLWLWDRKSPEFRNPKGGANVPIVQACVGHAAVLRSRARIDRLGMAEILDFHALNIPARRAARRAGAAKVLIG